MNDYENAIELNSVTKRYDGFTLDSVSLTVPKGSIMGFIGQNGAGKTTTMRSLLNITKIDSGEIKLLGLDHVKNEKEIKKDIAVVFDSIPFDDMFTPKDMAKIFSGLYPQWEDKTYSDYRSARRDTAYLYGVYANGRAHDTYVLAHNIRP